VIKKTGIDGMVEAVDLINKMSEEEVSQMRKNCRALVEEKFTISRMVDDYEEVYEQIISK
jgi:glycosyltransferase involved in cell wall biosynthesis